MKNLKKQLKINITLNFDKLTKGLQEVEGYCSEEEKERIDNFLFNLEELKTKYGFPIERIEYCLEEEEVIPRHKRFTKSGKMGSVSSVVNDYSK